MKLMLTLISISLLSTGVLAKKTSSRKYKRVKKSTKKVRRIKRRRAPQPKKYEISVAAQRDNWEDQDGDEIEGTGVNVSLGRTFQLGNGFVTTSRLTGSYSTLDVSDLETPDNSDYISYNGGLSQTLGYTIGTGGPIIRPFIGAEILGGILNAKWSGSTSNAQAEASVNLDYIQYGLVVGSHFIFSNGIAPFVKLKASRLVFSETASSSVSVNGNEVENSDFSLNSTRDERTIDNTSIVLGLSFLF